jgi:hypothetical protein
MRLRPGQMSQRRNAQCRLKAGEESSPTTSSYGGAADSALTLWVAPSSPPPPPSRSLEAVRLRAALVADFPTHDASDSAQRLPTGDLAVPYSGRIVMTRVLVSQVDPVLDRLGQLVGERQGHDVPGQLVSLEPGQFSQ